MQGNSSEVTYGIERAPASRSNSATAETDDRSGFVRLQSQFDSCIDESRVARRAEFSLHHGQDGACPKMPVVQARAWVWKPGRPDSVSVLWNEALRTFTSSMAQSRQSRLASLEITILSCLLTLARFKSTRRPAAYRC